MKHQRINIRIDERYLWINGKAIPRTVARALMYLLYAVVVFLAVMLVIFVLLPLLGIVLAFALTLLIFGAALMLAAPLYQAFYTRFRATGKNRSRISRWDGG